MTTVRILAGVWLALVLGAAHAAAPVSKCDRVGANPDDLDRVAPGVYWTVLNGRLAREACRAALEEHPDEPRFVYQYGRALARLDRIDEAVSYLTRAAEQGHLIAYTTVGGIYHFVTRNFAEAANWYQQGAELGSASAQVHLGDMYRAGEGFAVDPERAVSMYRKAALQGYALAQAKLAEAYEQGIGVARDPIAAAEWYGKAAEEGLPRAQHALARLYLAGEGVPHDPKLAVRWLRDGAEQGYGESQLELAGLYRAGTEIDPDPGEAYYWYTLASRHRDKTVRDTARAAMTEMCRARAAAGSSGPGPVAWCCVN